jgi:hypothetical protein
MNWLLLVLVVIAVLAFVVLKRRNAPASDGGESFPYVLGDGLFSPAERSFLGVLDQAVGNDFRVFGKVRVADVVAVAKGTPKSLWQRAFNRISAKHFDYVLCSPGDLKPLCAIELNDQSHAQDNRKGRDKFLEDVCAAAKLPLIFIPAQRSYTLPEVGQAIAGVIGRNGVVPAAVSLETIEQSPVSSTAPEVVSNTATDPVCPRCSGPMVRRIAKSGENAGKEFWGCTKFPACRGVALL